MMRMLLRLMSSLLSFQKKLQNEPYAYVHIRFYAFGTFKKRCCYVKFEVFFINYGTKLKF